jgi:ankyrin repeat protein
MTALTSSILPPTPCATPSKASLDLFYYVKKNRGEDARRMFKFRADPNVRPDEFSALHLASAAGNAPIVRLLLEQNANVNITTTSGFTTPLHSASERALPNIVQILLDAKANVTERQPLHYALESDDRDASLECVKLLIDARAAVNEINEATNLSPLALACQKGHLAAVQLLVSAGATPYPRKGIKPIDQALSPEIVQYLKTLPEPKSKKRAHPEKLEAQR